MNGIFSMFLQLLQSRGVGSQQQGQRGCGSCSEPEEMSCMKSMTGCGSCCDSANFSEPMSCCGGSFDQAMSEFADCGSGCGSPVMACCG